MAEWGRFVALSKIRYLGEIVGECFPQLLCDPSATRMGVISQ
jgi:hypothetical protein